ncbi:MAG: hypothetical protein QW416_01280 [Candidatus Nitrosocaldaceae archaeon]
MKILNIIIIVLLLLLFIVYVEFEHKTLGLSKPILSLQHQFSILLEILPWIIFSLFIIELYLKYRKINNIKNFMIKQWFDIMMTALFPIFGIFKLIKLSISIYKAIKFVKISKIITKIFIGAKKIFKN